MIRNIQAFNNNKNLWMTYSKHGVYWKYTGNKRKLTEQHLC